MANFIKKNNAKENNKKKVRHHCSGPAAPPNRFTICPGYHRDGGIDPVNLSRSPLRGLPAERLWRDWPTSGVLRVCNFSEFIGMAEGVVVDIGQPAVLL